MKKMDSKKWNEKIKNNFNDAAYRYLEHSNIQKFFAKKIVQFIKELNPQKKGEWIDLGSGPGLLADEIEKNFSPQKVSRIDFSKKMLLENKLSRKKRYQSQSHVYFGNAIRHNRKLQENCTVCQKNKFFLCSV